MRSLIQPPPGYAMAYTDWSGNEVGIAVISVPGPTDDGNV